MTTPQPSGSPSAHPAAPANSADVDNIVDAAVKQAHQWLAATDSTVDKSTQQLADMVRDPAGIDFTMRFVDRVTRPEDNKVAAKELRGIQNLPDFLGTVNKSMLKVGSFTSRILPDIVMPASRTYLRKMVGHLVLDANGKALNKLLTRAAADNFQLNLNLLGEAVLGEVEAQSRLDRTRELLANPRVTYVSIKATSVCAQLNPWDIEGNLDRLKERLRPLYRTARDRDQRAFVNMDMEEYKDLHLTLRLFTELMSEEEFLDLEVGIVLQAYLPDTYEALVQLAEFAKERRAKGGANIKIRLVKGANLSMERVDAEIHDWPQAPYQTKAEVDANYIRLLDYILTPEHADNVRVGVASHNLFTVALAAELAKQRDVTDQLDIEMLQGMAPAQAKAVRDATGTVILYTPVVHAEDFDVAVSYLVRRLEENGEKQNFLHALFAPDVEGPDHQTPMQDQEQRFRDSVRDRWATFAGPRRLQDRTVESVNKLGTLSAHQPGHFVNEPDTDPSLPQNRQWAVDLLANEPGPVQSESVTDPAVIDEAIATAVATAEKWANTPAEERAALLDKAADALADGRGKLISVMTHESGKTVAEADPEVSEAIDFAHYYAESARQIDAVTTAKFTPHKVTVVTPPWNFPVAIPLGGVFSALAAGSAVIIKPAPQVVRCAEVAVELLREAGIGDDLVQLVNADEADAGKRLMSHPDVDSVILTGSSETAKLFRSWKPTMALNAETSGKNAIVVTPAADPDLAVEHVYKSAFGHAGQKCSAASLVILVGSVGSSDRFLNQLVDAVSSLKVGYGTDISTTMNGVIEAPGDKLLRGLTQLDEGETWLIEPQKLNDEGTLWSPGLRDGVKRGSWYHTTECFGPILGIMRAETLEEAIAMQNETGFGLTGGIHSLDEGEIEYWLEHVEVGNGYVNRGITGAIVQRQSFGGWKNSSIGSGAKAGGPNYVAQQGTWEDADLTSSSATKISVSRDITQTLRDFRDYYTEEQLPATDRNWLQRATELDASAWATEFGIEHDHTAMLAEANIFRYRPMIDPLHVRVGAGYQLRDLLRILLGAQLCGTKLRISAAPDVVIDVPNIRFVTETDDAYAEMIEATPSARVRVIGQVADSVHAAAAQSGSVVLDQQVLAEGRRELLTMLLEQAMSITRHRFGYIEHSK
ncbi:bifunctional proline dehydrogenase/L-glutamate gamma-semialdehyde dehydrogenase [Corynebacterium ulceribovis]|uniref:bifunctional proline dehydrogenase/L-glutamate gamma-semialdehyde dehydrogenase n=1 Tax=Corynebacterium ulceribovis TaxID=487732 RepID=UPI000368B84E|nr:bifunctional proline dehydrogenase/L-glutamate gamma-semialdehyde dehydrogenase [Corynebacterium ulceribovis]